MNTFFFENIAILSNIGSGEAQENALHRPICFDTKLLYLFHG